MRNGGQTELANGSDMLLVHQYSRLVLLAAFIGLSACQHEPVATPASEVIPANTVSGDLLDVRRVKRPRAELRLAPKAAYKVHDQILVQNDKVAAFDQKGVWVKIIALHSDASGWVHQSALAPEQPDASVILPESRLPRVFAIKDVTQAFDYKTDQPIVVDVKRGTTLACLKKANGKVLVIVPATKAIMWFAQTDVQ